MQLNTRLPPDTAARSTGFRLVSAIAAALLLLACQAGDGTSLLRPTTPAQRAEALDRKGDRAGAAREWEAAARATAGAQRSDAALAATRAWLAAGDVESAGRAFALAGPPASPADSAERTRLEAEIALAHGQAERALALLKPLAEPLPAAALETRARAQFALRRPADGVRSLLARERLLDARSLAASQRLIFTSVVEAGQRGADLKPPKGADVLLAGWLDLGRAALDAQRNPFAARTQFQQWRARYPAHPADAALWRELVQDVAPVGRAPSRVALLLPLSGRAQQAGLAVRDGFLAAYYQQDASARPRVRLYDVARRDVASAYLAAVSEGAEAVVGPLTREEVADIARVADGRTTVLALNFLAEGTQVPQRFYQFALSPEDEAREVARRVVADGRRRGVALVPEGDWGQRVLAAFVAELGAAGGTLVDKRVYPTGTTDFEEIIVELLRLERTEQHVPKGSTTRPEILVQRRDDADFIFMPGQPVQGRLVRPQLKFQRAGDLPAYATSEIYDPSPAANADLDGVIFPDMPWVIGGDPSVEALRGEVERLWPDRATRRGRLYAMGFDAYRLLAELSGSRRALTEPVAGMTGQLSLDAQRRIHRRLDWVQVRGGQLRPTPGAAPPASGP